MQLTDSSMNMILSAGVETEVGEGLLDVVFVYAVDVSRG